MLQEDMRRVADEVGGGFEPGMEDFYGDRDEFVLGERPVFGFFGLDQLGQQVLGAERRSAMRSRT